MSKYLRAVLILATANPTVQTIMLPHIDMDTESINWAPIFSSPANTSGTRALAEWAYCLWTNEIRNGRNPFDAAHSLDNSGRLKLLEAIAIWLEAKR